MPRCGNCKSDHPTANDVRSCYATSVVPVVPEPVADLPARTLARYVESAGQPKAPLTLTYDLDSTDPIGVQLPEEAEMQRMEAEGDLAETRRDEAAKWASREEVETAFAAMTETTKPTAFVSRRSNIKELEARVHEGRYAIPKPDGTDFLQIDKPAKGKWKGYTFIRRIVGAPGDFQQFPVRGIPQRVDVLARLIEFGVEEAAREFGRKHKVCGACLSPLTHVRSRAAGYGETCASKRGYWYPSEDEAKTLLGE